MYNNVLITGGSGSFGYKATKRILKAGAKKVIIYSRDEYKQMIMKKEIPDNRVDFKIGDVRDYERLEECTRDVDVILHAAAMKHIDICEENKREAYKTNVQGSRNVVQVALRNDVSITINLSADKAVYPAGVYGKTKAEAEKIFFEGQLEAKNTGKKCRFCSIRYSNVIGSRGSVVEIFEKLLTQDQTVTVFDKNMMRFVITQNEVLRLVDFAVNKSIGGEIIIAESPMIRISDLALVMKKVIGKGRVQILNKRRSGEKYDAVLLSEKESRRTIISNEGYLILISESQNMEAYKELYGDTMYRKGEYGTHNAPLLKEAEIIDLLEAAE